LKRGYYVLIGGAALFAVGIALTVVWALPVAEQLQKDTTILQQVSLAAGRSASAEFQVSDPARPLSVVISAKNPVPMTAVLVGPDGSEVLKKEFNETLAEGAAPVQAGGHRLTVTNNGGTDTAVDIVLGYIPGVGQDSANIDVFKGVIAGVGMVVAGVLVMIAGVVVLIIDGRKNKTSAR
jgi:hypothetical protein